MNLDSQGRSWPSLQAVGTTGQRPNAPQTPRKGHWRPAGEGTGHRKLPFHVQRRLSHLSLSYAPLSSFSHILAFKRRAAAFTLLEVLVASAIMGIVLFVLVSTANTSLQLWRGTTEKIAIDREGRTGLALLAWDLQNIVQPSNAALRPWINTNINDTNTAIPVLRFLTLKPSDYQTNADDLGDICYVEYRFTNHSLVRAFLGSRETFTSLANGNGRFPTPSPSDFQVLVPNLWTCKFWGTGPTDDNIAYNASTGEQLNPAENLRTIEYRLGILDRKFMDIYSAPGGRDLAIAQETNGIRWFQAIQPVPPPVP